MFQAMRYVYREWINSVGIIMKMFALVFIAGVGSILYIISYEKNIKCRSG